MESPNQGEDGMRCELICDPMWSLAVLFHFDRHWPSKALFWAKNTPVTPPEPTVEMEQYKGNAAVIIRGCLCEVEVPCLSETTRMRPSCGFAPPSDGLLRSISVESSLWCSRGQANSTERCASVEVGARLIGTQLEVLRGDREETVREKWLANDRGFGTGPGYAGIMASNTHRHWRERGVRVWGDNGRHRLGRGGFLGRDEGETICSRKHGRGPWFTFIVHSRCAGDPYQGPASASREKTDGARLYSAAAGVHDRNVNEAGTDAHNVYRRGVRERVIAGAGNSYEPPAVRGIFVFTRHERGRAQFVEVGPPSRHEPGTRSSVRKVRDKVHMCAIYARCELLTAGVVVVTMRECDQRGQLTMRTIFIDARRGHEAAADVRACTKPSSVRASLIWKYGIGKANIKRIQPYGTVGGAARENGAVAEAHSLYEAAIGTGKLDVKVRRYSDEGFYAFYTCHEDSCEALGTSGARTRSPSLRTIFGEREKPIREVCRQADGLLINKMCAMSRNPYEATNGQAVHNLCEAATARAIFDLRQTGRTSPRRCARLGSGIEHVPLWSSVDARDLPDESPPMRATGSGTEHVPVWNRVDARPPKRVAAHARDWERPPTTTVLAHATSRTNRRPCVRLGSGTEHVPVWNRADARDLPNESPPMRATGSGHQPRPCWRTRPPERIAARACDRERHRTRPVRDRVDARDLPNKSPPMRATRERPPNTTVLAHATSRLMPAVWQADALERCEAAANANNHCGGVKISGVYADADNPYEVVPNADDLCDVSADTNKSEKPAPMRQACTELPPQQTGHAMDLLKNGKENRGRRKQNGEGWGGRVHDMLTDDQLVD
ncbi:hypothetical protein C8R45DRAFT_937148 [Mycena sanguinolenta]|nr:hypothetical protein C8R45DRAFT_937148 [Mycena sanguinolenta]